MATSISYENIDFDMEVPVLVIGAGGCGLTAGLAARSEGAEVIVLERDPVPAGSTAMSQGYVCAAGTKSQTESQIEDSPDIFYADIMAKTSGQADEVIARTVAGNSGPTVDWLTDKFDVPFSVSPSWSGFFGHSVNRMHGVPSKTGEELSGALAGAAANIGVDIVTDAHVTGLFATDTGLVRGVSFQRPDGSEERIGCKALIASTCGFGGNREMIRKLIPEFGNAKNYKYFGHEGNKGDGILWGMELGGAVDGMNAFQGYGALAEPHAISVNYDVVMGGGIAVNILGQRFSDEIANISGQAQRVLDQPSGIAWLIFDDVRGARCDDMPEYRQLSELGAVRVADTLSQLAEVIGVPGDALAQTMASVDDIVDGRAQCPFGRDFGNEPKLQPGYRAIRITGALYHTQGGLKVDSRAQVLKKDGGLLPNFFAGGGAAQGISGNGATGYLPAAGLCTALTLGRLAGQSAAEYVKKLN
ncbi:MAG: FAD-binding protein [Alphaproteobacteria bacterium]|nr:FAD-binding protein [Alphaproteobacteria bacterium]